MGRKLEATLAVLNGAIGDYLARTGNGLATETSLVPRIGAEPLRLDRGALAAEYPGAAARVALFVHRLMCTETIWEMADGSDYGARLATDLGYVPVYLRYNSGLAIAENGARLSTALDAFAAAYPVPIRGARSRRVQHGGPGRAKRLSRGEPPESRLALARPPRDLRRHAAPRRAARARGPHGREGASRHRRSVHAPRGPACGSAKRRRKGPRKRGPASRGPSAAGPAARRAAPDAALAQSSTTWSPGRWRRTRAWPRSSETRWSPCGAPPMNTSTRRATSTAESREDPQWAQPHDACARPGGVRRHPRLVRRSLVTPCRI